jgi:hypothetical protein
MPVILATQEAAIRRIEVWSQPRQIVCKTLSGKNLPQKTGLVEWLKVKALSSSPSNEKKAKVLREWFKWHSTCLSSARLSLILVLKEKRKKSNDSGLISCVRSLEVGILELSQCVRSTGSSYLLPYLVNRFSLLACKILCI